MKKRILFVDDEREILDGLRNRLRRHRQKWVMTFVEGAKEALEVMGREPVDVIVSDIHMPGIDGAALLERVREEYPTVARIVLSGYADEGEMLRTMATAHQFLPKPCEPELLESAVSRICDLQAMVSDDGVRRVIGKMVTLPSRPAVYSQMISALADEENYPENVAQILEQDSALCAHVLHIVNSAYYGLARPILRAKEAVVYLGLSTVRQLVLISEVFQLARAKKVISELTLEYLQGHAVLAGGIASTMFSSAEQKETAFIAALLHDIGKLLLVTEFPERVQQVVSEIRIEGGSMFEKEKRLFGVTHAEIGAFVLGLWQIPFPIVEAVAYHHAPEQIENSEGLDVVAAVHIADVLANEQMPPSNGNGGSSVIDLEPAYLERLGVSAKLTGWREIAGELMQNQSSGYKGIS